MWSPNAISYCCGQCSFTTANRAALQKHAKTHFFRLTDNRYACPRCPNTFTTLGLCRRHFNTHTDRFKCNICGSRQRSKTMLRIHMRFHSDERPFKCPHCTKSYVQKIDLDRHILSHGDSRLKCPHCNYRTYMKKYLPRHIRNVHDIGKYECKVCYKKCAKPTACTDPNTQIRTEVCRSCFHTMFGKKTRVELIYSEFLDAHFGTEFLVASDARVDGSCLNYRPDKLYASLHTVLHVEIDEYQHQNNNGNYSCDERRLSEMYEPFAGKKYIIFRVNPHGYRHPDSGKKPTQGERMQMLLTLMQHALMNPPKHEIFIFYVCYSMKNPRISRHIPHALIFDESDVERHCM